MSSCDLKNNPRAEATLAAYLRGGRLPHAILVEGLGNTLAFAKKIAKAAICADIDKRPCGVCRDCLKAEKGVHPDLTVYSGGDRTRSFHIDTVRELRQEAYIKPNESECKAFILENVQNMTVQAQNALLKIIEEPPANIIFILTCENKSVLLETILSRVSVFSLDNDILSESSPENAELREKAGDMLTQLLGGSELEALAAFAPFERDRTGFAAFLAAVREEAVNRMLDDAKSGQNKREDYMRLSKIVTVIDDMTQALAQNVSGLLLTAILPAKFKS